MLDISFGHMRWLEMVRQCFFFLIGMLHTSNGLEAMTLPSTVIGEEVLYKQEFIGLILDNTMVLF